MNLQKLKSWVHACGLAAQLQVSEIPFLESLEWLYADVEIKHRSNRFFKVIGVVWKKDKITYQQLFIDQSEIGTLGFILHQEEKENSILIQAKVEPGNVGLVQIAPTCQATLSNLDQVHGGRLPQYASFFASDAEEILSHSLQSEQGMKFFGKRNNNVIVAIREKIAAMKNYKWVKVRLLCKALAEDYLVNTDARSVLVTSNWQKLLGDTVFNSDEAFITELKKSYLTKSCVVSVEEVVKCLQTLAVQRVPTKKVPIGKLENIQKNEGKIISFHESDIGLIHVRVNTKSREVQQWDQPLIKSFAQDSYTLYCGRLNDILFFCFKFWVEPGLYNHVELGPDTLNTYEGEVIKSCWQSDEGGRFFQNKNRYRLVDIGQIKDKTAGAIWLSLSQVQELSMREGIFCNEARSAISLILSMI